jgi:hypothetical protein
MEPDKIRILLKDIREARQAKCRQLLLDLDDAYVPVRPLLTSLGNFIDPDLDIDCQPMLHGDM